MITVREDTTLVGISELRTNSVKVLEAVKKHNVLLEKRNRPLAMIVPIEKYTKMEELIELIEDYGLGLEAKERDSKSSKADYLDLDAVEKKIARK